MRMQARPFPTSVVCILTVVFAAAQADGQRAESPLPTQPLDSVAAATLVREVVYNELHDHERHGWWRYWVEKHAQKETRLEEQVETKDGPVTRTVMRNGRPVEPQEQEQEEAKLHELMSSPGELQSHRQAYLDDEKRIGRILALLPDAFLYEDAGEEKGLRHLKFRPNPNFPPHSIEARIFHAMQGELWIDPRMKRLAQLSGHLEENVDFGYGILGRLYKGGWFELRRVQVEGSDWKTERLEVHMNGRAMLFKTIARETSEVRGGFVAVPAEMNLAQGMQVLAQQTTARVAQVNLIK